MKEYSLNQIAQELQISKKTLRYYDSLKLVSPKRRENNYRYYSQQDYDDLILLLLLKYGGFSLEEIGNILKNRHSPNDPTLSLANSRERIRKQQQQLQQKIENLKQIVKLMDTIMLTVDKEDDCGEINQFIQQIYQKLLKDQETNL